jgi:hypothetical protein
MAWAMYSQIASAAAGAALAGLVVCHIRCQGRWEELPCYSKLPRTLSPVGLERWEKDLQAAFPGPFDCGEPCPVPRIIWVVPKVGGGR